MTVYYPVVYKGIQEVKGGSFTDDNGVAHNYDTFYKLFFDQPINGIQRETFLKVPKQLALNVIQNIKAYDRIVLNLDIIIYSKDCISLKIVNIEKK